ncbi:uncharacterized protein LOC143376039 [Andrena cerasifolii]|uniref:uncharacterized protein LOC143376039 n=1 Tax=Andrena cerasifolii TaxID=2819439 RepID=UPI004037623B
MDVVPLLTPTMESELLKDPWVFPQPKANTIKEEEKPASSTWEENFQDLSDWCMDTFQGQCDFHAGESPTFKLSGTKYEGNSVLSSEVGVLSGLASVEDEGAWSTKMDTAKKNEHLNNNCYNSLQSTSETTSKRQKESSTSQSNSSNSWLKLPKGATAALNATSLSKQNSADVNTPSQSRHQVGGIDLDDACPSSFDSAESQRETWDMLCTMETNGSDTFDLLSYLCDDEMRSPDGSNSTDSSIVSKPWSPSKLQATATQANVTVKTESQTVNKKRARNRASSTVTSSSMETASVSPRRSGGARASAASKVEKMYKKAGKRGRPSKRRYVESDSDDQPFVSHYRESREKNNEASRKSRMNKKAKESEMSVKANQLEKDNRILKMKVEELEKLVTSMRNALLRSALKKEF